MLSIAPAVADGSYYLDAENYYDADALGEPQWIGKAAAALGLTGPVDGHTYDQMCQGNLLNGVTLGKVAEGERQHAPGWDMTFSAPKSVSIMALVGAADRCGRSCGQGSGDVDGGECRLQPLHRGRQSGQPTDRQSRCGHVHP